MEAEVAFLVEVFLEMGKVLPTVALVVFLGMAMVAFSAEVFLRMAMVLRSVEHRLAVSLGMAMDQPNVVLFA